MLYLNVHAAQTVLKINRDYFNLNNETVFLLGISYYSGAAAPVEFLLQDLQDFKRYGFNWIRIWATWSIDGEEVSVIDKNGNPREPYLSKLRWIVEVCNQQGIVVDITFSRDHLEGLEAHKRALQTVLSRLKGLKNYYVDIANERNIQDTRYISVEEAALLVQFIKDTYPDTIVTASHAGDLTREDLLKYTKEINVDMLAIHRPRNPNSPSQTERVTRIWRNWLSELDKIVPIHFQEPLRRGYMSTWNPTLEDFLTDLKGAIMAGAAGWCFHNGDQRDAPNKSPRRSFDLRHKRLFDQLDSEEINFLKLLQQQIPSLIKTTIKGKY